MSDSNQKGVEFYRHSLGPENAAEIAAVLATPFLTSGAVCKRVEGMLCEFFGTSHAFMTSSWTNGAIAALLALGIGPGDEVIVPAMTFIATANVVELLGAKPVFVDVDPETLLMTPEIMAGALTRRTRAVMPVNIYGQVCDIAGMRRVLAAQHPEIVIIEDAAHSFESVRDGYLPGAHSDLAIFSFYTTKNITCGEGGAIVTKRADLADRIHSARLHGMTKGAADRFNGGRYNHWDMICLGTKANLPDLLAALLPSQIATIRERLTIRREMADRYRAAFRDLPLRLVRLLDGSISAEYLFSIHVPPAVRDEAIAALNQRGISVTVKFRAVPAVTYYREKYGCDPRDYPVSFEWGEGQISLPFYPGLPRQDQDRVIDAVYSAVVPLVEGAFTAAGRSA
ncbi:MAG TPA: DegT/DnrJ/EryC1/StrS family aminotransferase [Bryobacteraceae bacterium]|nr:DegT/DnrJ/EryC1/StrS family aminotransferase [Bryobacteraceae bacterium]